ncbi:hypothetical protein [Paraurantiacibacter namhicola]|uniref:Uncharacterized protein n=1 Tax=Paraurantiacibacter namhicola TaxID=645517 RepID=A0A1C7D8W8_9SPHN|nr:hypothetical protein [Paraurantiacibacter namhicola]ANU07929.1 hypothetical protein A6F65_01630 [Paraurantiacibacter namhicola]
MSQAREHMLADRDMRNAARRLFQTDLEFIKTDLAARGVGGRIADRIGDSTMDLVDDAVDYAADNKGMVTTFLAGIALWFARKPLLAGLERLLDEDSGDDAEQSGDTDHYEHD